MGEEVPSATARTLLADAGASATGPTVADTLAAPVSGVEDTIASAGGRVPAAAAREGQRLAHFQIERLLGQGGMGAVYLARDLALDRLVALKVLPRGLAASPSQRERFVREARVQARLNHPNICHVYYTGEADDQLFFAMEYVEGETLQARLDRGPMPLGEAIELCRQVALGLREAQRHGLTHRDIKPSNLMIDARGTVKIVDFGIVKQAERTRAEDGPALTAEREVAIIGTPCYMAPEQALGRADYRSDIYALGVTLHHMIAGKPPFSGPDAMSLVAQHLERPRPRLVERRFGVAAIDRLCDRMTAKSPEGRFQSYDELIAAFDRVSPTRRVGLVMRAACFFLDFMICSLVADFVVRRFDRSLTPDALATHVAVLGIVFPYFVLAHARAGRTLVQHVLGLEVVNAARSGRPSLGRSALRAAILLAGCLLATVVQAFASGTAADVVFYGTWGLFLIATLLDPEQRTPWDRASDTRVRRLRQAD